MLLVTTPSACAAQKQVAAVANVVRTALHWQIGHHLRTRALEGRRAEYGGQIVSTASRQLAERYGLGFNEKSLRHMVQFATAFPSHLPPSAPPLGEHRRADLPCDPLTRSRWKTERNGMSADAPREDWGLH
jgi:hypothetical protein